MATAFNISTFRAKLGDGGVRPNQFQVTISPPTTLAGFSANPGFLETTSYLVNVAELPGQTLGVAPVYYRGREIKLAGDKTFAPFTCTVLNDSSFTLRSALESWMGVIENNTSKTGITNPADYFGRINVSQLDRNGKVLRAYQIEGAWPVDVSPIGLDFAANDQLSTFSATFQYMHFTTVSGDAAQSIVQQAATNVIGNITG